MNNIHNDNKDSQSSSISSFIRKYIIPNFVRVCCLVFLIMGVSIASLTDEYLFLKYAPIVKYGIVRVYKNKITAKRTTKEREVAFSTGYVCHEREFYWTKVPIMFCLLLVFSLIFYYPAYGLLFLMDWAEKLNKNDGKGDREKERKRDRE